MTTEHYVQAAANRIAAMLMDEGLCDAGPALTLGKRAVEAVMKELHIPPPALTDEQAENLEKARRDYLYYLQPEPATNAPIVTDRGPTWPHHPDCGRWTREDGLCDCGVRSQIRMREKK